MQNLDAYIGGIDVCAEDGEIDWGGIRNEDTLFCLVKATEGNGCSCVEDENFCKNFLGAYSAGFRVGAYHYLTATNITEAREQALGFLEVISLMGIRLNFYCGVVCPEESDCAPEDLAVFLDVFCSLVTEAGYNPIIHAPIEFLSSQALSYPFWVPCVDTRILPDVVRENAVLLQYKAFTAPCDTGILYRSAVLDSLVFFRPIFSPGKLRYPKNIRWRNEKLEMNLWAIQNGILPIGDKVSSLDVPILHEEAVDILVRFMEYYRAAYGVTPQEEV